MENKHTTICLSTPKILNLLLLHLGSKLKQSTGGRIEEYPTPLDTMGKPGGFKIAIHCQKVSRPIKTSPKVFIQEAHTGI